MENEKDAFAIDFGRMPLPGCGCIGIGEGCAAQ
jgi:hypothetical protein